MTTIYFGKNGKALGTDDDYYGSNYHSCEKLKYTLPYDFEVRGKTMEEIVAVATQAAARRKRDAPNGVRAYRVTG